MPIARKLSILALASGFVAGGVLGAAGPASAVDSDVTFEVTADTLDITAPASADVGSGSPGGTLGGALGAVSVTDGRAALDATWTATVSSTDFTTGGGTAGETIGAAEIGYWSGPATSTTGTGTFTPGQVNAAAVVQLGEARTAFTKTGGSGSNSATWNPTLVVAVPSDGIAGTYSGTITHSVA